MGPAGFDQYVHRLREFRRPHCGLHSEMGFPPVMDLRPALHGGIEKEDVRWM